MKGIKISLNLLHFFQDYRQLAKIFINNDLQTIYDLQEHIVNVFSLENNFYLMCENHFLPPVENIRILNDNDYVYVMPHLNTTINSKKSKFKTKFNGKSNESEINIETIEKCKKLKTKDTNELNKENEISNNKPKKRRCTSPIISTEEKNNCLTASETINKTMDTQVENTFRRKKLYSGIGTFLQFVNDSKINSQDSATATEFLTKRKRTRTRKRKQNKTESLQNSPTESSFVYVPPKTRAAPKQHIHFNNNDLNTEIFQEINKTNENSSEDFNTNITQSTPFSNQSNKINNISIDEIKPETLQQLNEKPPKNSLILFKKLKIGENYTPEISNYILGQILDISTDDQLFTLKIIEGNKELQEPKGKFSCIFEKNELENDNTIVLERSALIDAKIVK